MHRAQNRFLVSSAAQLFPYIQLFKKVGAPYQRAFERAKLPAEFSETDYVPTDGVVRFVHEVTWREGIRDFASLIQSKEASYAVHKGLRRRLSKLTTLYSVINTVARYAALQGSHFQMWTQMVGDCLWFCHRTTIVESTEGLEQFEYFRILRVLDIIRSFLGAAWYPPFLCLASGKQPRQIIHELFGGVEIRLSCPFGCIPIPLECFSESILRRDGIVAETENIFPTLESRVRLVLKPYIGQEPMTVNKVADLTGMSPRSLQRTFTNEGTSLRKITDDVKYQKAEDMLLHTDLPISEIAEYVNFTDESNFGRFFKRVAGCSPSDLRRKMAQND